MKKHLYIFNPWHDMALANFTPYYRVPAEIVRMSNDLSFLPLWYAPDGALIYGRSRNLMGINFYYPYKLRPLPYGNESIGSACTHRATFINTGLF